MTHTNGPSRVPLLVVAGCLVLLSFASVLIGIVASLRGGPVVFASWLGGAMALFLFAAWLLARSGNDD